MAKTFKATAPRRQPRARKNPRPSARDQAVEAIREHLGPDFPIDLQTLRRIEEALVRRRAPNGEQDDAITPSEYADYLRDIRDAGERIGVTIEYLLTLHYHIQIFIQLIVILKSNEMNRSLWTKSPVY